MARFMDRVASQVDRFVGLVNPVAGIRRQVAREVFNRAYEGASQRDGWKPRRPGASANTDHRADGTTLRIRARSLVQNSPYIAHGLASLVANVVGTGFTPRSLAANARVIDALWDEWSKVADADGRLNLAGLQSAAYRAMEQDGEVLVRQRTRRAEDNLPVPLQLQLLEIDWLDSTKNGTIGSGGVIVNGIEYDALGRKINYWLFDSHPGELTTARSGRTGSSPVPAANIIHLFNPERPGQGRGITRLAPVIATVRDLTTYEDAELQRKNLETRLAVIASGDVAGMGLVNPDDTRTEADVKKSGNLGSLAGGSIIQVPSGLNLTVVEPKVAPGYVGYVKQHLHKIAAGMGITYEMLTGDLSEVNFSSARVGMLEFRRQAEALQWNVLIPNFAERIWRAFIDAAVLGGQLARAEYTCDWSTPKWDYVNPVQDVAADLDEIGGGLSSISEKLRRRGYKPAAVFAEIKTDYEQLKKDGTLDFILMLQRGRTMGEAMAQASTAAKPAPV